MRLKEQSRIGSSLDDLLISDSSSTDDDERQDTSAEDHAALPCCIAYKFVAAKDISCHFDCCAKQGSLNFWTTMLKSSS